MEQVKVPGGEFKKPSDRSLSGKSWTSALKVGLELMNSIKSLSSTDRDRAKMMAQNLKHAVVMKPETK